MLEDNEELRKCVEVEFSARNIHHKEIFDNGAVSKQIQGVCRNTNSFEMRIFLSMVLLKSSETQRSPL